jgi:threonine/homoserine/homoserine lactone efflux protein
VGRRRGSADGHPPHDPDGWQTAHVTTTQAIGQLLPIAAAVALSPIPIVAVILVLTSAKGRVNGTAFALGWIVGLSAVSIVVVAVTGGASDADSATATGVEWGKVLLGLLLVSMAHRQWRKRPKAGEAAEMPAWMASLADLTAPKAVGLGLLVSAANPKNLILTAAAAATIAQAGLDAADETVAVVVIVVLSSVVVVGVVVASLIAGPRADAPLASLREFMARNSATIMMVVLLLLGLKVLGEGLGGL